MLNEKAKSVVSVAVGMSLTQRLLRVSKCVGICGGGEIEFEDQSRAGVSPKTQTTDGTHTTKSVLKSSIRRLYFSNSPNLDVRWINRSITPFDAHVSRTATILPRSLPREGR